ncbi:hypothetical protein D3C81_2027570 [compost metagenome]
MLGDTRGQGIVTGRCQNDPAPVAPLGFDQRDHIWIVREDTDINVRRKGQPLFQCSLAFSEPAEGFEQPPRLATDKRHAGFQQ